MALQHPRPSSLHCRCRMAEDRPHATEPCPRSSGQAHGQQACPELRLTGKRPLCRLSTRLLVDPPSWRNSVDGTKPKWVVGSNSLAIRYGIRPSQHLNITSYYERRQARALENFYALDTAAHAFSMEKTALPTEFRTSPERSPRLLHTGRGKGLRLCWARAAGVRVPVQQT